MEEQIKLLKKYRITDYVIENGKLIINKSINLSNLKTIEVNFLNGVIVKGALFLNSLTIAPEGFLKNTIVNGGLDLRSLTTAPKWFLENNVINGWIIIGSKIIASFKEGLESDFNILPLHSFNENIYLGNRCRINLKGTVEKYPNKKIFYYC
jgi:hypothetical protein